MPEKLTKRRCIPCEGGVPPLTNEQIAEFHRQVPDWRVVNEEKTLKTIPTLQRRFTFKDFRAAMDFLRQVEGIAEAEGHHPDFCVHYNKVDFKLYTHAIGGLHDNDFILAAKIDALMR